MTEGYSGFKVGTREDERGNRYKEAHHWVCVCDVINPVEKKVCICGKSILEGVALMAIDPPE